jgi:hypothetical protein
MSTTATTIFIATISDGEITLTVQVAQFIRTEWVPSGNGQPPIEGLKEVTFYVTDDPPRQWMGKTVKLETPTGETWWVFYDGTQFVVTQKPAAAA